MKLLLLFLLPLATSFTLLPSTSVSTSTALNATPINRKAFLKNTLAFTGAAVTIGPNAAFAKFGASIYPSPSDAQIDTSILKSDAVQASLKEVKSYLSAVQGLSKELDGNSQADLIPSIRRNFEFSSVRNNLNTITTVFDDETQRSTDRVNRIIIQDITELEASSKIKEGIPRSDIRLGNVRSKLGKLEKAFSELLEFTV
ncbi:hypothetical protein TrVE_jg7994 [Triparma verrucosa]|uniref:Uncharacterized protein n=1 Tax=Triparma verrucosa TaxID=1606542 RepID=A0A9W7BG76_9STRA|nr:hypothetical protein TrVE_jg7994 [Triparma verrucosa]